MPASSGDPISAALTHSLGASSKCSSENEDFDSKLIGSAKRVLLTEVKYEQTSSYSNNISELKSKYIVLKPSPHSENSGLSLNSGVSQAKAHESKTARSSSPKSPKVCMSTSLASPGSNGSKSDAVLPKPKKVLFPPENIQLGWQSKSVPVGSGMVNLGNTCYLNSTLQALFHIPAFVNWLVNDKAHKDKCETTNGLTHTECLICAMQKTLKSFMENSVLSNAIRPQLIYNKLKLICKRLMHGRQEDAHEFIRHLIECMDRSYLRIVQADNLESYSKETSPLSQIFGGYLRTEVTCLECRHISLTFQFFQDLLLDIRQSSSVDEALETYFSRENLGDGDEVYKCDKCHRRVAATKQFAVEKPPNVLCIQLKRFGIMGGKNSKHIQVQQYLDLTRFWVHSTGQPACRFKYRLVSLVSHIGPSSNCGHYTAIGLTPTGQFYLYDDSLVRPVTNQSVGGNNTYIIMYELCSKNPILSGTPSKTVAGNCTITKPNQPSNVASPSHSQSLHSTSALARATCTKNGQSPPPKSLVPYSAESSDSDTESSSSKQKVTLAVTPVKNGFAKESSSCAKYSNSAGVTTPLSTLSVSCNVVVMNGWHVTSVAHRSPSDALHSPLQNWDVIDTSDCKNGEISLECSPSGGNSSENRQPTVNGSSENCSEEHKRYNGTSNHTPLSNGKNWDGKRNGTTVEFLRNNSHQGYGHNVSTWNGNRTQVDRDVDNDRILQQKRSYNQMYEDEYDQGKVKKNKSGNHHQRNGGKLIINGRRNFFQEQQNYKNNNNWYERSHSYRNYSQSRPHHNRSPGHRWRRWT